VAREYERKYPTTGFWIFVCNLKFRDADKWLETGENELFYKISEHHRSDIQPGQLGILRIDDDGRNRDQRGDRSKLNVGIYAVFQVLRTPEFRADPDNRFYRDPEDASKPAWRVWVRVVANLLTTPVLANGLPREDDFAHIHRPLMTSTLAIREGAFSHVIGQLNMSTVTINNEGLIDNRVGIRLLEVCYLSATPKVKENISRRIERGLVGVAVKQKRKGHCQICEALGANPIAFTDRKGKPFAEAHHVIPVSWLEAGSLSYLNIMVLCPNHHRQAHYGEFKVTQNCGTTWSVEVDGLKDPLILRQCIHLRDVAVLLNRGSYVEQYDRRIEAWLDAGEGCSELPQQCS
jgi:hypothetical protein